MRKPIYLQIVPDSKFDFVKFFEEYAKGKPVNLSDCQINHIPNPIIAFKDELIEEITKYGFTNYLNTQMIFEDLTTPSTPQVKIESLLIRYLSNINLDNELIIIDPYFFAPNINSSYCNIILNILKPFKNILKELKIVTATHSRAFSPSTKANIEMEINKHFPSVNIVCTQSNYLHDRFWISGNRNKGIITGTSLNGLGKKYSIIDYLNDEDVINIVDDFASQQLI